MSLWRIAAKHRLDTHLPVDEVPQLAPVARMIRLHPASLGKSHEPNGVKLALEEMGTLFLKLGQLLSTRRDLVSPDIIAQLEQLQDRVKPFSVDVAITQIQDPKHGLGSPIDTLFARFDKKPLAAASIAQVHTAAFHDGREVVVKVVRPDIRETIVADFELLRELAAWASARIEAARAVHIIDIVEDYRQVMLNELDLTLEAANTTQMRNNFLGSRMMYVPEVYDASKNVMVMERISGVPISHTHVFDELGYDRAKLAEKGLTIFFTQVFRDNFFHADMHPGNVFVETLPTAIADTAVNTSADTAADIGFDIELESDTDAEIDINNDANDHTDTINNDGNDALKNDALTADDNSSEPNLSKSTPTEHKPEKPQPSTAHLIEPRYIGLDCAIMGELSEDDQLIVARLLLSVMNQNFTGLVDIVSRAGWIPPSTDKHALMRDMRRTVSPMVQKPINEIDFAGVLMQILDIARRHHMSIPPQLMLLLKTLVHVEGLGRDLYPDLDIWSLAKPILTSWVKQQLDPVRKMQQFKAQLPELLLNSTDVPKLLNQSLQSMANQGARQEQQLREIQQIRADLLNDRRKDWLALFGLLISIGIATQVGWFGIFFYVLAAFIVLWRVTQ